MIVREGAQAHREHAPPTTTSKVFALMDDSSTSTGGNREIVRASFSFRKLLVYASWLHAFLVLIVLALFSFLGESWWPVSLLLFCPRWLFLAPLLALCLATARTKSHSLWLTHLAAAIVIVGPLMRPNVPLAAFRKSADGKIQVRVLTLNQHNGTFRVPELIALIEREKIDLLCFQEVIFALPLERYLSRGWFRDHSRCIASRLPIVEEIDPSRPPYDDPHFVRARIRAAPGVDFVFASVHGPTIRPVIYHLLDLDTRGLASGVDARWSAMRRLVDALGEVRGAPTIVAGDFNAPAGSTLLNAMKVDFRDGFERAGWGFGYTWPSRLPGLRIDQIYATPEWTFRRCWVGPDIGSDHRPVIAELTLPGP